MRGEGGEREEEREGGKGGRREREGGVREEGLRGD